jgi:signal transduction histidine kinase
LPCAQKSGLIDFSGSGGAISKEVFSQVREPDLKSEGGWPSRKLRLTLLISFGGLLALMVIAGLGALRLARQLQTQEEEIRQAFLAHSQPLLVLSSSIYVYNDRLQEYLMSQDPQSEGLASEEFSRLTAEINSTLRQYPGNRQPEERALLESLQQMFTEQEGMLNPVLSWSREERRRQALRFLNEEVLPQRSRINEASEKIALWNNQQLAAAGREMFASFASLQAQQTSLLAIALTAGLVLSLASIFYLLRLGEEAQRRYLELARSRAELEELSAQLVDAQETERRSISRELHDEVGQSLGALLDDLGLIAALEWQGREVSRRSEMEVEVQSADVSEKIPDEYRICIYRLVQEALNNAARHSSAKNARVTVDQTADKILVSVFDDGRGFDPQRVRGLGILGMEERVRRLGGILNIDSKPGRGTTLKAEFPLPQS